MKKEEELDDIEEKDLFRLFKVERAKEMERDKEKNNEKTPEHHNEEKPEKRPRVA